MMRSLVLCVLACLLLTLSITVSAQDEPDALHYVNHRGQALFLNGMNLAWMNFAHDLTNFDEVRFVAVLDELVAAKGNTLRWWLHTNGSASPLYGDDGKVIGSGENELDNLRRAVDLAYERGILIMPTLWSHDMMNTQGEVPTAWNQLMIEDPVYTQAYIDNALIPMVEALKGHPGIIAWEIMNEPEGTTSEFGWTDERTEMPYIQQFVNLLAGAIHRTDPDAQVTNGSWNMRVLTDIEPFTNYYTDERLIEAGGDPDGKLDFYSVHYYPEHFDETTSPFHHPFAYWELDKPLVVGEFPATAIKDLGMGFRPKTTLENSVETYSYLLENGYAGALAWTFYASPHGSMAEAKAGILAISDLAPAEVVMVDVGEVNRIPVMQQPIANAVVNNDVATLENYVDLTQIFSDVEDGGALKYEVTKNSQPELVTVTISDAGVLSLAFTTGMTGTVNLQITATDSGGNFSRAAFVVQVVDPNKGNIALGKKTVASTTEGAGYLSDFAVDGLDDTRWSSEYVDGQTLDVDLGGVFTISQVILKWEAAFGDQYQIQVWDGSAWQTVFEEMAGDGGIDDLTLAAPVDTRYVRMNGLRRGEAWGFSLWEFEVYGTAAETVNPDLETAPDVVEVTSTEPEIAAEPVITEATLLNSFEDDVEGWLLADFWAGSKGLAVSTELATEGTQSLALNAVYTGGSWQEAGASVQLSAAADWTGFTHLAVDVYMPEGATDFISQIFVKTGEDWAWANTSDTPLQAGAWTTVMADLSTLGDMTAVREYGIKVGTSVTVYEGAVLIDNVRLVILTEAR